MVFDASTSSMNPGCRHAALRFEHCSRWVPRRGRRHAQAPTQHKSLATVSPEHDQTVF
jgi:hypothetical protein